MKDYDFSGWATRNNIRCSDGRTILKDAFKHNDGSTVPLVWNHQHNDPENILGHALLENREEGVYAYCKFNGTAEGQRAKQLVEHGDIKSLSIYANQLKQQGKNVLHGAIREVSLVLAGANPEAFIETVIRHGDGEDSVEEAMIFMNEDLSLYHAEDHQEPESKKEEGEQNMNNNENLQHADGEEKTVADVFNEMTEEQKTVVYALIGQALEDAEAEKNQGGNEQMKHNVFESDNNNERAVLTHADQTEILKMAKSSSVGSLKEAMNIFAENNDLKHADEEVEDIFPDSLFPDYQDVRPGAPELIERDQSWVATVMKKVHKSPISRIRTRQADVTGADFRALGYKKKDKKTEQGVIKLLKRTTDPQTVYRKDSLERDDIIDITDFDVVAYKYGIMKSNLNEELATAFLIGDGRDESDENKIHEIHIRSVWNDDELYTIHADVDIAAAKAELQGGDTSKHFGDNYIYAEAIIQAALYAREKYKGSGNLDFYCTPHLLNVMLLARDLNGRRIYDSKNDLAAALNVNAIYTVEQFEGKTRTTEAGDVKKLLGLFVNLADYQVGCTKGGEITKFEDFDIDFNQYKYLIETRLSGTLTRIKSAIALEEPVTSASTEE